MWLSYGLVMERVSCVLQCTHTVLPRGTWRVRIRDDRGWKQGWAE